MGTSFEDIYDLAMVVIRDYKLDKLAETDIDAFKTFFEGFLIKGIPKFHATLNNLDYDLTLKEFVSPLTVLEKDILSDLIVIEWFKTQVQDVTQFNLHLSTRDFKAKAEDSNLKQKSEYLDRLQEKVRQSICDYQITNVDILALNV